MKRFLRRARIGIVLTALACGNLDNITVTKSASSTVQGTGALGGLGSSLGFDGFNNIDVSDDESFKNQGYSRNEIDSVKLKELTLDITAPPSGVDFTFIKSIKFYASSPNLAKVLIASGGPFTAGARSVGLDVEDQELVDYATADSMTVTSEVNGTAPSQDTTVKATLKLDVDVNIKGVICDGGKK
jgi:hypothetical protein